MLPSPTILLSAALAFSMLANGGLWWLRNQALTRAGAAEARLEQVSAAAKACSDGVVKLRAEEAARKASVDAKIKQAEKKAREAEKRALSTLQATPKAPGDACKSASILSAEKLAERRLRRVAP